MKLKIPLVKQRNKLACGPTCLRMVFSYYGKDFSEKEVLKGIELIKTGSYTTDNAIFAAKLGFKVECYSYNLKILTPKLSNCSKETTFLELKKLRRKAKRSFDKGLVKSTIKMIKSGVVYKFIKPKLSFIDKYLQKKIPVITPVNFASLKNETGNIRTGHFIVITGKEGNNYFYNDPWTGKEYKIDNSHLFFAISNNVLDSSAYLLVIKP